MKKKCLILCSDSTDETDLLLNIIAEPFFDCHVYHNLNDAIGALDDSFSQHSNTKFEVILAKPGRNEPEGLLLFLHSRSLSKSIFHLMHSATISKSAIHRMNVFQTGAVNMISHVTEDCRHALKLLAYEGQGLLDADNTKTCPYCNKTNLSEDQLCLHVPLFHTNESKISGVCPICEKAGVRDIRKHLFFSHTSPAIQRLSSNSRSLLYTSSDLDRLVYGSSIRNTDNKVGAMVSSPESYISNTSSKHSSSMKKSANCALYSFTLCVIRHPASGKFLLVQEHNNQGYWLPGGKIDAGEDPVHAAIRETKEEAGIDVDIKGLLRLEISPKRITDEDGDDNDECCVMRMRYIFYGEPTDVNQELKTLPDHESLGACWFRYDDELQFGKLRFRGDEPKQWFHYVSKGGVIYPMSIISAEGAPTTLETINLTPNSSPEKESYNNHTDLSANSKPAIGSNGGKIKKSSPGKNKKSPVEKTRKLSP